MTLGYQILTFACLAYGIQLSISEILIERSLGQKRITEETERQKEAKPDLFQIFLLPACLHLRAGRHCSHRSDIVEEQEAGVGRPGFLAKLCPWMVWHLSRTCTFVASAAD